MLWFYVAKTNPTIFSEAKHFIDKKNSFFDTGWLLRRFLLFSDVFTAVWREAAAFPESLKKAVCFYGIG